jgi:hypothetical protein
MLNPVTYSLSTGTAQDNSEPSCLRFGIVPVSRMSGMMEALGTMHSAWRAKRLPLGRSLTRL